jgi:hypothetical protein
MIWEYGRTRHDWEVLGIMMNHARDYNLIEWPMTQAVDIKISLAFPARVRGRGRHTG